MENETTATLTAVDIDNLTLKLCRMTDDDLFQSSLITTLKPIILEVAVATNENRTKLFELLVHINNRIRAVRQLKMPLEPFIELLNECTVEQVHCSNLAHMYIKLCYPRCEQEARLRILPLIFMSLTENKTEAQKDILLHLILPTLQLVKLSNDPVARRPLELINAPYQRQYILEFFCLIMLTPYNYKTLLRDTRGGVPDGMSQHEFSRVTAGSFIVNDDLEKIKCGIAQFLAQRPFPDEESVSAMCLAHSDTRHSVISIVDREAKQLYSRIDWDKLDVLGGLLSWFLPTRPRSPPGTARDVRARTRLPVAAQIKMGALLLRSRISLPNKLAPALSDAASATFLNCDNEARCVHPKQVETGFALVAQLCAYCSDMTDEISEQLLKNLIFFMQKQLDQHETSLKSKALNLIPQVLKRNHRFLLQDTNYLSQLFDSLCNANIDSELRDAVKDCLRSIAIIFQDKNVGDDPVASATLEGILYLNFNKEEEECRMSVVYFSGLVYSSVHIPTRFLLLEALGDQSKLVRQEAEHVFRELFTPSAQHDIVTKTVKLPYFVDLVNYHGHLYNRNLFSDPVKLIPVVEYIRMCILSLDVGLTDTMKHELLYDNPDDYRFRIYRNIQYFVAAQETADSDAASSKALEMYCKLVQVIYYTKNYFMNFLEEIIAASPKILPTKEGIILHRTKNLLLSDCQDELFNRENCASAHALLAMEMENEEALQANLKVMLDALPNLATKQLALHKSVPVPYAYHGNALGFAHLLERIVVRQKKLPTRDMLLVFLNKIDPIFTATSAIPAESTYSFGSLLDTLCVLLDCLHVLCQSGALSFLPPGKFTEEPSAWPNKALLAKRCLGYIRGSNFPTRVKDSSLRALAALCMGESNCVHSQAILETLLQTHSIKDPFLHRSIAQTIVSVVMGAHSPYKGRWYERHFPQNSQKGGAVVKKAVAKDLQMVMQRVYEILATGNSISRHNAAAWSLYLVQKLGWHPSMSLSTLHSRILVVLGDKDEMSQDAASCVLGTIYEQSSIPERKLMSEELIQVILHGQRGRLDVPGSEEAKFTDAELEARDSNKATYKELCSLANELNQPDFIYSFMPLATGQGKWAVRGGAAIGLGHMLMQHSRELEPHIPKMVPKLFRYRFDPHVRTQKVMEQIWNNLGAITPTHELVKNCFPEIVEELKRGLVHEQNRVREASCHGIRSLLQHEMADPLILVDIGDIVCSLLRVMDDTKIEIRDAAIESAKGVEKFCALVLDDPARRQSVEPLLSHLVPVLLEHGLPSKLSQVHQFALSTLGVIVHSGRNAIRCAIPSIVISALQALSSMENSQHNYISQQWAGMGSHDSRERWDIQRVNISKQSPLSDILSGCIRYIEDDTQAQLLVPLADIVRHGVGLPTKCGTAKFLIDLSQHCGSRLMGATGKLLAALLYAVLDKNEVVQREMAKAIGCLVKFSKKSSVEKLFVITRSWYFENSDSEEHQLACCHVYQSIEKYAPGTLELHAITTLPLIFLAKQNEPESNDSNSGSQKRCTSQIESCQKRRTVWSQIWVECVRSEGSVIMEMMPHILACLAEALASSHFHIRTQGTLSLMALVRGIGRQYHIDDSGVWTQLYNALMSSFNIKNRFWAGKVYLLYATKSFVRQLDENSLLNIIQDRPRLIQLLIKETTKADISYRCVAFEAVAKVSDILNNECLTTLLPMMTPLIAKGDSQVAVPEQEILLRVMGHMWPKGFEQVQEAHFVNVVQLLSQAMEESQWKQQIAVLKSFKSIFKKTAQPIMRKLLDPDVDQYASVIKCLKAMLKSWKRVPEMIKYKQLRESCLDTIEILFSNQDILLPLKDQLKTLLHSFNGDSVPTIKEKALALIKIIS